jgi:lipoprotein Spr
MFPLLVSAQRTQKVRFIEDIVVADERAGGPVFADHSQERPREKKVAAKKEKVQEPAHEDPIEDISSLQFKYALITGREVEKLQDDLLYEFIEDWYGTPYHMGGTSKKGVDCSGFTRELMRDVYEVQVPRTARDQYEGTDRVRKDELVEGDLVFFNTGGHYISHVGVYLGNNYFVHSSTRSGVVISSLEDDYYHKHYRGAGRNPTKYGSSMTSSR